MRQREKPMATPEQLAATFNIPVSGIRCSGGMIENFREGWAHPIWGMADIGHYFKRDHQNISEAKSYCGLTEKVNHLYGIGNYRKCKRCEKQTRKAA